MLGVGYPSDYVPGRIKEKTYDTMFALLQGCEEKLIRHQNPQSPDAAIGLKIPITFGDMAFLAEELYRGRSAITGIPTKLMLIRWNKPAESTLLRLGEGKDEQKSIKVRLSDLVCMTKEEAMRHQKEILLGDKTHKDLYDASVIETVEARRKEAMTYESYR